MSIPFVGGDVLREFLGRLDASVPGRGYAYLIGETSQVLEGWRAWTDAIELTGSLQNGKRHAFGRAVEGVADEMRIPVRLESPADVIPLPGGYEKRWRRTSLSGDRLEIRHFDPYSVSFRFLARGDASDYQVVLAYLSHGWVERRDMEAMLSALLPRFDVRSIGQDAEEFRRRYRGLMQMWQAEESRP